jgi:hypothetical protein
VAKTLEAHNRDMVRVLNRFSQEELKEESEIKAKYPKARKVQMGCENRWPAFRANDFNGWLLREDEENFYVLDYNKTGECIYPKYAWVVLIG